MKCSARVFPLLTHTRHRHWSCCPGRWPKARHVALAPTVFAARYRVRRKSIRQFFRPLSEFLWRQGIDLRFALSVIARSKGIDKGLLCLSFEQVKEFGTQAFAARCGQCMELKKRNHGSSSFVCAVLRPSRRRFEMK